MDCVSVNVVMAPPGRPICVTIKPKDSRCKWWSRTLRLRISAGVNAVFPQAEQRDDCFHAVVAMNKVRRHLEQAAYRVISAEYEADATYTKISCQAR